jgi:signal transduction histidine kinase
MEFENIGPRGEQSEPDSSSYAVCPHCKCEVPISGGKFQPISVRNLNARILVASRVVANAQRQREELLAFVDQELLQPMAAIASLAVALTAARRLAPPQISAFQALLEHARALASLAEEVLLITQGVVGRLALRMMRFDLGILVGAICTRSSGADRIVMALPAHPVMIDGDPDRIGEALANLLTYSLRYSDSSVTTGVVVTESDASVVVEVHHHGGGAEQRLDSRIFGHTSQLLDAHSETAASGRLGLSLAKVLVEAHGGTLESASAGIGHGATFTIKLPKYDPPPRRELRIIRPEDPEIV